MSASWTLAAIAEALQLPLQGDGDKIIKAVAPIDSVQADEISYIRDPKYARLLANTQAGALILNADLATQYEGNTLISPHPYLSYAKVVTLLYPVQRPAVGVHASAVIADDATLGENVSIGPHVVVEHGASIGANSVIGAGCYIGPECRIGEAAYFHPRVTLAAQTQVGARAIFHSGVVLGADGFGFIPEQGEWYKIPQVGYVSIGNDVEIGANTCIDRAALGTTRIGNGVKLDNLIHIAHNVHIGDHTVIAGCTGIAGSAQIGQYCQISGMCSIAGHIKIADRVTLTGTSFVINSIPEAGVYSSGITIEEHGAWRKNAVRFRQLDQLARRLAAVEKELARLQKESS